MPRKLSSSSDRNDSTNSNPQKHDQFDHHQGSIVKVVAVENPSGPEDPLDPLSDDAILLTVNLKDDIDLEEEVIVEQTDEEVNEEFDEQYLSLLRGLDK